MYSSKAKTLVVVTALLITTGLIAVGCKAKEQSPEWVNSKSMPGSTFKQKSKTKRSNSSVIYLGSNKSNYNVNFGPKDVSFDFNDLK